MSETENTNPVVDAPVIEEPTPETVDGSTLTDEVKNELEDELAKEEPEVKEDTSNELQLMRDVVPEIVRDSFAELPRDLEDECAQISALLRLYFEKPDKTVEYGMLIVKTMEFVERLQLSPENSKMLATRCVVEFLMDSPAFPVDTKTQLMENVPSSIEAIIALTKGEDLNRLVPGAGEVETAYVTRRAVERILDNLKANDYDMQKVMQNSFFITMQVMFFVGGFPSLSGAQKKAIVIDVFKRVLKEYKGDDDGPEDPLIAATLDTLPALIDTFVRVSSGEFHINDLGVVCCHGLAACLKVMNNQPPSKQELLAT